jgi:hypothetical protein
MGTNDPVERDVNPASGDAARAYPPTPVRRPEHAESTLTRLIEQQAAKLPSDFFLFTALGAMAGSLALELSGHPRLGRFVGMWPPALLTMGIYNKLVKVMGSH